MEAFRRMGGILLVSAFGLAWPAHGGQEIAQAQRKLKSAGFYHGPLDGIAGSQTAAAIRRYQIANNLRVTGELNAQTFDSLGIVRPAPVASPTSPDIFAGGPLASAPPARREEAVRSAQRTLKEFGYYGGSIDGQSGKALAESIKAWQRASGLPETGTLTTATLRGLGGSQER